MNPVSVYDPCPCKSGKKFKFCCLAATKIRTIDEPNLVQLKMSLDGMEPPIWRRILIDDSLVFADLHTITQRLIGWIDDHMHEFDLGNNIKLVANPLGEAQPTFGASHKSLNDLDENITPLGAFIKQVGQKFLYEYDFGDCWEMTFEVEAITPKQGEDQRVWCLAGERNGPPDDCGGVWCYADAIEALKDKKHPSYNELLERYGEDFDAEYFNLDEHNKKFDWYNNPQDAHEREI